MPPRGVSSFALELLYISPTSSGPNQAPIIPYAISLVCILYNSCPEKFMYTSCYDNPDDAPAWAVNCEANEHAPKYSLQTKGNTSVLALVLFYRYH